MPLGLPGENPGGGGCSPSSFGSLVGLLRFYALTGKYGVLDRLGFAQSSEAVVQAVYEALRTVEALARSPLRVKRGARLKREGVEEPLRTTPTCIEYDEYQSPGELLAECRGLPLRVEEAEGGRVEGFVCCYTKPQIPDREELERFFSCVEGEGGLALAKKVAALALAYPKPDVSGGG